MPAITNEGHRRDAALLRNLMATYERSEDLVRIGAYKPGSDVDVDRALAARQRIRSFMMQDSRESVTFGDAVRALASLAQDL